MQSQEMDVSVHWCIFQVTAMSWTELIRRMFVSPTWMQGPKALGHPVLLSQCTNRKLDGKWKSQDRTQHPYEMLVLSRKDLATSQLHWAPFMSLAHLLHQHLHKSHDFNFQKITFY